MAKKKRKIKRKKKLPKGAKRIDTTEYGIDLPEIVDEIVPHFEGMTRSEIGEIIDMPHGSVSNLINGAVKPSLGAVAALAHAAGGRLVVTFEPPKKRKRSK